MSAPAPSRKREGASGDGPVASQRIKLASGAAADVGMRFRFVGGMPPNPAPGMPMDAMAAFRVRETRQTFDPDTTTWLQVVESILEQEKNQDTVVWRLPAATRPDGKPMVLGVDIPLADKLSVLNDKERFWVPGQAEWPMLRLGGIMSYDVTYEQMQYAMAAAASMLVWPPWHADDVDPINLQVLGAWDDMRARRGSTLVSADENNGMENLVGLRRGAVVRWINIHAMMKAFNASLQAGAREVREPVFNTMLDADQVRTLVGFKNLGSTLPILDLDDPESSGWDLRYGDAFARSRRRRESENAEANRLHREAGERIRSTGIVAYHIDAMRGFIDRKQIHAGAYLMIPRAHQGGPVTLAEARQCLRILRAEADKWSDHPFQATVLHGISQVENMVRELESAGGLGARMRGLSMRK